MKTMKWLSGFMAILVVSGTTYGNNLLLVEFETNNYDSTLAMLHSLESMGATPRHIFPPNIAFVDPHELPIDFLNQGDGFSVFSPSDIRAGKSMAAEQRVLQAFLHITDKASWDQLPPDDAAFHEPHEEYPAESNDSGGIRTSLANSLTGQYMIGYIAVGIYLMESTGSQEDWYPSAEQQTFNEIVQGLDWLAQEGFNRGAKVVWVYPPVETISTAFEPINGNHVPFWNSFPPNWVFGWLNDIYTSHGLAAEWDGAYALANKLRKDYRTNWAVEITVVMDDNDADHKFSDGFSAYASSQSGGSEGRSPIVVMTYNNNGWTPANMHKVVSHEVSHVFGASDEYYRPPDNCSEMRRIKRLRLPGRLFTMAASSQRKLRVL